MESVSEAEEDSTNLTVVTHIFTKPHLSFSQGLSISQ